MSETLEELKAIVDNAPDGATHIDDDGDYAKYGGMYDYFYSKGLREWISTDTVSIDRSLSDIKRIIELTELLEDISALGFLEATNNSGKSHRDVCDKAKLILGDL